MNGGDRRLYRRAPAKRRPAWLSALGPLKSGRMPTRAVCTTRDLSQQGARFESHEFLAVGDTVRIAFSGSIDASVSFISVVRWVSEQRGTRRFNVGCMFQDTDARHVEVLKTLGLPSGYVTDASVHAGEA